MSTSKPADKYAWYYPEPVKKPNATLAGMVTALDSYVGSIVDVLEAKGIAENTLIVFTSDNGPHDEGGADPKYFKASAPYKGMKRDLFDGGIHVPMIVYWPESIKSARVDETPWAFADVLPTFADIARVPLNSVPRIKTNGVSIADRLTDSPKPIAERTLYWEFGKQAGDPNSGVVGEVFQAARRGKWKAVRYGTDAPVVLFHLEHDPSESKDVSKDHPLIHEEFESLFKDSLTDDAQVQPDKKAESIVRPPPGRLAIVVDGNSPDPDDIGATAVIFGLLNASGLNQRLVHLSHSCDLKPVDRISPEDEKRRQLKMHELCREGVSILGPYKNIKVCFNCRSHRQAAVDDLRDCINRSSNDDPLWIIEAGEPDIIGFALRDANPAKRQFVHVVSHHPANDDSGDFFQWQQILDFDVTEHQIGDQNIGLQTLIRAWDWTKDHPSHQVNWIRQQLSYAEQDDVVRFQSNKFDCSDAGMVYWWITGADQTGNAQSTPVEIAQLLRKIHSK